MPRLLALLVLLATVPAVAVDRADLDARAARLKRDLPGFTVLVQPPFVVVGDGASEDVQRSARDVVQWAVSRLERDYFEAKPREVITVYLFKDRESYESNTLRLFDETPVSPYGYYSPAHRALIMNIATGGGTLVHEIVHPYIAADFPGCPTWMNEGLASLYEQCGERDGHIVGYPNWRLPALQEAIRKGGLTSFERLASLDHAAFYSGGRGVNYAQARYLCYYLQERGLLVRFYKAFRANRASDPTGIATLKRILGTTDLPAFQRRWERFVLDLRYR